MAKKLVVALALPLLISSGCEGIPIGIGLPPNNNPGVNTLASVPVPDYKPEFKTELVLNGFKVVSAKGAVVLHFNKVSGDAYALVRGYNNLADTSELHVQFRNAENAGTTVAIPGPAQDFNIPVEFFALTDLSTKRSFTVIIRNRDLPSEVASYQNVGLSFTSSN